MSDKINVMIVEDQAMPRQLFEEIIKEQLKVKLNVAHEQPDKQDTC